MNEKQWIKRVVKLTAQLLFQLDFQKTWTNIQEASGKIRGTEYSLAKFRAIALF